ncbi:MAG: aminotransferase class V-fold PLP-dependent enzyme, partial [Allobaculum sp.]|nr:aminotransferase class V-fold PLP-dependent enzyme [Allobaculum sp.]
RWSELCDYYGCDHIDIRIPFGKDIDYGQLEDVLRTQSPDTLLCQHHETSSGQLYDINWIADLCKEYQVSLVVDGISSFLVEDFDMDALGVDIAITSSQKGLNIPPGLSILFFSKRLLAYPFAHNSYYFDFQDNLNNLTRGQTPFSPATMIFLQLHARLKQYEKYGIDSNKQRVRKLAKFFRSLCERYGWKMIAETPSDAITGFTVDGNPDFIVRSLIERYDTFIMPGSKPGFFRVSHMGDADEEDLEILARRIHELESL